MIEEIFDYKGYTCYIELNDERFYRVGYVVIPLGHPSVKKIFSTYRSKEPCTMGFGSSHSRYVVRDGGNVENRSDWPDVLIHGGLRKCVVLGSHDVSEINKIQDRRLDMPDFPLEGCVIISFACNREHDAPDLDAARAHLKDDDFYRLFDIYGDSTDKVWSFEDVKAETKSLVNQLEDIKNNK